MGRRAIAFVVVAAVAIALGAWLRTANRADAAHGDCYAAQQGPSTPTICN